MTDTQETFDVFLIHNSRDKATVRRLAKALKDQGLHVWLDEAQLIPGRPWQEELERIIQTTKTAAVLVGKDGLGPWEVPEMRACLNEFVTRKLPVIPVLLPNAENKPELPLFLKAFTWVDLREGIRQEGVKRLVAGIQGTTPGRTEGTASSTKSSIVAIEFTLDGHLREFDESQFMAALSGLPGMEIQSVKISGIREGSIKFRLEGDSSSLETIVKVFQESQDTIQQFADITDLRTVRWERDGKTYELNVTPNQKRASTIVPDVSPVATDSPSPAGAAALRSFASHHNWLITSAASGIAAAAIAAAAIWLPKGAATIVLAVATIAFLVTLWLNPAYWYRRLAAALVSLWLAGVATAGYSIRIGSENVLVDITTGSSPWLVHLVVASLIVVFLWLDLVRTRRSVETAGQLIRENRTDAQLDVDGLPNNDRVKLILQALQSKSEFFAVDPDGLTKGQRYDVVLRQIEVTERRRIALIVASVLVVMFLGGCLLAFGLLRPSQNPNAENDFVPVKSKRGLLDPPPTKPTDGSEPTRVLPQNELQKRQGLFEVFHKRETFDGNIGLQKTSPFEVAITFNPCEKSRFSMIADPGIEPAQFERSVTIEFDAQYLGELAHIEVAFDVGGFGILASDRKTLDPTNQPKPFSFTLDLPAHHPPWTHGLNIYVTSTKEGKIKITDARIRGLQSNVSVKDSDS